MINYIFGVGFAILLAAVVGLIVYVVFLIKYVNNLSDKFDRLEGLVDNLDNHVDDYREDVGELRYKVCTVGVRVDELEKPTIFTEDGNEENEVDEGLEYTDIASALGHLIEIDERIEKRVGSVEEFTGRLLHEYTRNCEHRESHCPQEYLDKLNRRYDPALENEVLNCNGERR